jgi:BirA family biotin operon repressor/biotin-[acetyl-CoA-carboxylase] ligase
LDLIATNVASRLRARRYGRSIDVRMETDSTNDDAREALERGAPDGHVVVADQQRRGRGARGRRWDSPAGTDLYLSIVARVPLELSKLPPLTLAVGLGLARAAETLAPHTDVAVKWPNDLLIDGLKCAGVLVEASARGTIVEGVVIGIGLDVNRVAFEEELADLATSLRLATGLVQDRATVLARVLDHVEEEVDRFVEHGVSALIPRIDAKLALRGSRVRCDEVEGVVLGLAPTGALRLETATGIRDVVAGSLRPV